MNFRILTLTWWMAGLNLALPFWPSVPASAQGMPIQVGMSYSNAKTLLIKSGWQPLRYGDVLCDDNCFTHRQTKDSAGGNYNKTRFWEETLVCLPTQPVTCEQLFFSPKGRGVILVTESRTGTAYVKSIGSSYVYRQK
jgi:hypothetical protein